MKFFAVFSALLAVALAGPSTWTLHELSEAIQNPSTDPALLPILEEALNDLMLAIISGSPQDTITVATPVQELSSWTLAELDAALQNPATDPALLPYLEEALNSMMEALITGHQPEYVIVATPVGLLPTESVVPAPVESPVAPAPAGSPLVQIIINVRSQEVAPAPTVPEVNPVVPEPVVLPSPVLPEVVPSPVVLPQPVLPEVNPVDIIAVNPGVNPVVPEPVVLPQPVLPEVNPVDIIAVNPVVVPVVPEPVVLPAPVLPEVNPVDIIAVNPGVAINPVDILHPMPVVAPVNVVDGIMV